MICLTFDTDWMTDATLSEFLHRVQIPGRGTFFCHNTFSALAGTRHELGPHPFIERLSESQQQIAHLTRQFAEPPRGLRTHSCVFSHMIGIGMFEAGYRYVSQAQHLFQTGLRPYRHPWGIWEIPIYYMDNMDFCMTKNWSQLAHVPFRDSVITAALESDDLFVFAVHPIHIALNTGTHEDYSSVKARIVAGGESPFDLRFSGRGTESFYLELCEAIDKAATRSFTCSEALEHFGCE
jgi:hypothetical protein